MELVGVGRAHSEAGLVDKERGISAGQRGGGHAQGRAQHGLARQPGACRLAQPHGLAADGQVQRRAGDGAAGTPREVHQKRLQLLIAAHLRAKHGIVSRLCRIMVPYNVRECALGNNFSCVLMVLSRLRHHVSAEVSARCMCLAKLGAIINRSLDQVNAVQACMAKAQGLTLSRAEKIGMLLVGKSWYLDNVAHQQQVLQQAGVVVPTLLTGQELQHQHILLINLSFEPLAES